MYVPFSTWTLLHMLQPSPSWTLPLRTLLKSSKYHRDEKKEARTHPREVPWYKAQRVVMRFKAQVTDVPLPSCLHLHAVVFQAHPVLVSNRSADFTSQHLLWALASPPVSLWLTQLTSLKTLRVHLRATWTLFFCHSNVSALVYSML